MEASFSGCWQLNQPASHWWVSDYFQSTSQYVSDVIECQHPCPAFSWHNVMAFLFGLINDIWNNTSTFQTIDLFQSFTNLLCDFWQQLRCSELNYPLVFFVAFSFAVWVETNSILMENEQKTVNQVDADKWKHLIPVAVKVMPSTFAKQQKIADLFALKQHLCLLVLGQEHCVGFFSPVCLFCFCVL